MKCPKCHIGGSACGRYGCGSKIAGFQSEYCRERCKTNTLKKQVAELKSRNEKIFGRYDEECILGLSYSNIPHTTTPKKEAGE